MQPVQLAPESLTRAIIEFGGRLDGGKPIWRVALAQTVTRRFEGRLPIWPAGENKSHEFVRVDYEKDGKHLKGWLQVPTNTHPERWETGPHWIPKYPCKGWVLERWMPPHVFGDKHAWEKQRDQWGDPIMGAFPHEGDYWMLDGPWERIPSLSQLEASIASTERDRRNRSRFFEFTLSQLIKDQQYEEEQAYLKWEAALADYCKKEIDPIFKTVSLGAQRVRNEVQESLGQRSHLGAGQQ